MPSRLRNNSISSDSSDDEDGTDLIITNGTKTANGTTNGVNGDGVQEEAAKKLEDEEPEEHVEPGMKNGLHNLYSGKEGTSRCYMCHHLDHPFSTRNACALPVRFSNHANLCLIS
jgi:hypothetical protein